MGRLTLKGNRYLLIRPETVVGFQKAVEAEVGIEECARMMLAGGRAGGSASSRSYREMLSCGKEDIVDFMCEMGCELGWGDFQLHLLDLGTKQLVVDVADSAFAEAYGPSPTGVCHLIRGVLEGLGASVFEGETRSLETACRARGDKICRFEINAF